MAKGELQITIFIQPKKHKRICDLALSLNLSNQQFYRNVIDVGLDNAEFLNSVGLLGAMSSGAEAVRKIKEKFDCKALVDVNT